MNGFCVDDIYLVWRRFLHLKPLKNCRRFFSLLFSYRMKVTELFGTRANPSLKKSQNDLQESSHFGGLKRNIKKMLSAKMSHGKIIYRLRYGKRMKYALHGDSMRIWNRGHDDL